MSDPQTDVERLQAELEELRKRAASAAVLQQLIMTVTLCAVVAITMIVLVYGLFDNRVNNADIFGILKPAIASIIAFFMGRASK